MADDDTVEESTLREILREAMLKFGSVVPDRFLDHTVQRIRDCIAGELRQAHADQDTTGSLNRWYITGLDDGWDGARRYVMMPLRNHKVQVD